MCLVVSRKQKPKIAEKDIKVWKVMSGNESAIQKFTYRKGKIYRTIIKETDDYCVADDVCIDALEKIDRFWSANKYKWVSYGQGFHSFVSETRAIKNMLEAITDKDHIKEFLIPKGSVYYRDVTGCIISNQIIML